MNEHQNTESNLDERLASYLRGQANSLGRRSALAKVGKILLRLSGLTLIPLLPLDRRFEVSAQSSCTWQTCGMCGILCNSCCNNSGGFSRCPTCSGMVTAGSWGGCCYASGACSGTQFYYADCCTTNQSQANSCKGTACQAACYPHFPAYCASGCYYSCTIVTQGCSC
jgi:hypothetical protein